MAQDEMHPDAAILEWDSCPNVAYRSDYKITQTEVGLTVEIQIGHFTGTFTGSSRDHILDQMKSLLDEYERKAIALDIEEGNYG